MGERKKETKGGDSMGTTIITIGEEGVMAVADFEGPRERERVDSEDLGEERMGADIREADLPTMHMGIEVGTIPRPILTHREGDLKDTIRGGVAADKGVRRSMAAIPAEEEEAIDTLPIEGDIKGTMEMDTGEEEMRKEGMDALLSSKNRCIQRPTTYPQDMDVVPCLLGVEIEWRPQ